MTPLPAPAVRTDLAKGYVARIEVHLAKLAQGHDPLGHLFGIECLARAARAEWWAVLHETPHERPAR